MLFRRNWIKTTGRVLDSRIRTLYHDHADGQVGGPSIPLHNYVVEFAAPNGATTRLEVEQHLETVDFAIGTDVPLLVSPDGKKAIFDKADPSINMMAVFKANKKAEQERFRRQVDG